MSKSYKEMVELFNNPSSDYNPVTMWFWNDKVTKEGITKQLLEFREQGILEFFVHPNEGAQFEYLSDEYMELVKHAVCEAKRLGMKYWIYDEYDWPSGSAGGILTRDYPQYRQQELWAIPMDAQAGAYYWNIYRKGKFVGAQRVTEKNGRYYVADVSDKMKVKQVGEFVDVEYVGDSVTNENIFVYIASYVESVIPTNRTKPGVQAHSGYLDMLSYEAVGKFIELTHEKYKAWVGDEFGKTVPGVFTDEPTTMYHFNGVAIGPWNDEFAAEFEKRRGYSLLDNLYALCNKTITPFDVKVRNDYRKTIKEVYHRNFTEQIANWCKKNDLKLTGHYGGEEVMGGYFFQGDMQEELMKMDIPGMDTIWCSDKIEDNNYNIAGKLVSGAAKYAGKDRVLSETYTCSYWSLKMPAIKRVANRLLVTGANMLQYMGAWYAAEDRCKWPGPAYSFQNPIYQYFGKFGSYVSSLQSLSAATKPYSKVLMLIPLAEAISRYSVVPEERNCDGTDVQRIYEDTLNTLLFEGIGFDLLSDNLAGLAKLNNGTLSINEYEYDCVILPKMKRINESTAKIIDGLKNSGVKIIFVGDVPEVEVDNGEETGYKFSFAPLFETNSVKVSKDGNVYLVTPDAFPVNMADYRKAIAEITGNKALNIDTEDRIYIAPRSNENCEVYYIANDENRETVATVDALPGLKLYNAETRKEKECTVSGGRAKIVLAPYELVLGLRDKNSAEVIKTNTIEETIKDETVIEKYDFVATEGNQLPIKYEVYDSETDMWWPCEKFVLSNKVYVKANGKYKLRATFNVEKMPEKLFLHGEAKSIDKLLLNDAEVKMDINIRTWTDYESKTEVTNLVKLGENTLELDCTARNCSYTQGVPFMMVTGDFGLDENDTITELPTTVNSNGWENNGFTYYSGEGVYKMEYTAEKDFEKAYICLGTDDVAKIYVNGQMAACRLWEPYKVDITNLLNKGKNNIEVHITATRGNMFMKEQNPSRNGLTAPAKIILV